MNPKKAKHFTQKENDIDVARKKNEKNEKVHIISTFTNRLLLD